MKTIRYYDLSKKDFVNEHVAHERTDKYIDSDTLTDMLIKGLTQETYSIKDFFHCLPEEIQSDLKRKHTT